MPPYTPYAILPLEHMMATDKPRLFVEAGFGWWVYNGKADKSSFVKRWGYSQHRNLGDTAPIYNIAIFQTSDGSAHTIYLTDKDACRKESGAGTGYTDLTFTIENLGTGDLTLSGTPIVTIGGDDADQFSVLSPPSTPTPILTTTTSS